MTPTHHDYCKYVFTIDYQPHDPAFTVTFPDFPEIITSGATLADAFANACEALDLHLESVQKLGKHLPILNAGFARNPWRMKTGIQLSKMIVTSSHSESGCHEDSMLFRREVCQCDLLGSLLF